MKICYTCKWRHQVSGHQCCWFTCRKSSPTQSILAPEGSGNRNATAIWLTVKVDDFCGDWEKKCQY